MNKDILPVLDEISALHIGGLKPLLTLSEAAEIVKLLPRHVESWADNGELAHAVLGGEIRIHPDDLEEFIRENTVKAIRPKEAA